MGHNCFTRGREGGRRQVEEGGVKRFERQKKNHLNHHYHSRLRLSIASLHHRLISSVTIFPHHRLHYDTFNHASRRRHTSRRHTSRSHHLATPLPTHTCTTPGLSSPHSYHTSKNIYTSYDIHHQVKVTHHLTLSWMLRRLKFKVVRMVIKMDINKDR